MRWETSTTITLLSFLLGGCSHLFSAGDQDPEDTATITKSSIASSPSATPPRIVYHQRSSTSDTASNASKADKGNPKDLWTRVRAGLQLHTIARPEVSTEIAWFEENTDFLDRSFTRARPYLHYIVDEVERRGMPTDIALLPVVESGFQPMAYSPG